MRFFKSLVACIMLLYTAVNGHAQQTDAKFKELFGKADGAVYDGNFALALPILEDLIDRDSANAHLNYLLGVTYLNTQGKRKEAIEQLEKAINNVKLDHKDGDFKDKSAPGLAYFYLAKAYHYDYQFDEAITHYFNYRSFIGMDNYAEYAEVKRQIEMAENAKTLTESPVEADISMLTVGVNSKYDDFSPVISPDGLTLIFTSRRDGGTGGKLTREGKYFDEIYTTQNVGGKWSAPKSVGSLINSAGHEASTGISSDGRTLLIYKDENSDGNLFYSNKAGENWGAPQKFGPTINTKSWETHAILSNDGSTLFFTSNKPGGVGGRDIYYSKKLPSGDWGAPKNLGRTVNSIHDEDAPFISADGGKLYFSSRGHASMGGFDIMYCTKEDTGWSEPVNIGYPINTPENDVFYVLTSDESTAYYSSIRQEGLGGMDIYKIKWKEPSKPISKEEPKVETVAILKGKISSEEGSVITSANITATNKKNGEIVGIYKPNSDGNYLINLKPGEAYLISYETDGFLQKREEISFSGVSSTELVKDVVLAKIPSTVVANQQKAIEENKVVASVEQTNTEGSVTEYSVTTDYSKYIKQQGKTDLAIENQPKNETEKPDPTEQKKVQNSNVKSESELALEKRKQELLAEINRLKNNNSEEPAFTKTEVQNNDQNLVKVKQEAEAKQLAEAKAEEERKAQLAKSVKEAEERAASEAAAKAEEERKLKQLKAAQEAEQRAIAKAAADEQKRKEEVAAKAKLEAEANKNQNQGISQNSGDIESLVKKLEDKRSAETELNNEYERLAELAKEAKELASQKAKEAAVAQKEVEKANLQANNAKALADLKIKKAEEAKAASDAKAKALAAQKAKEAAAQKALETKSAQLEAENAIKMAKLGLKDGEELSEAIRNAEAKLKSKSDEESVAMAALKAKEEEVKLLKAETERIKTEKAKAMAETKQLEELRAKEEQKAKMEAEAKEREAAQIALAAKLKAETEARNAQIAEEKRLAKEKAEEEKRKAAEAREAAKVAAREKAIADSIAKVQQKLAYEAKVKAEQERKEKEQYELRVQYESGEMQKTINTQKKRIGDLENDNRLLRDEIKDLNSKVEFLTKELEYQKTRMADFQQRNAKILEQLTKMSESESTPNQQNVINEKDFSAKESNVSDDDYSTLRDGQKIVLKNIYFDYNKSFLKRESFPELNKLYNYLIAHSDLKIEIGGHTDSKGNDDYNYNLSRDRAISVMEHLTAKGISGKRLRAVGYGENEPVAPNTNPDGSDNPEGRQKNRRIEIKAF